MWANNYNRYLFGDVNSKEIIGFEHSDKIMQNLFRSFLIGSTEEDQVKDAFIKVKNTALAEIVNLTKTDIETILKKAESIGVKKNNDYGSDNILKYGIIGIVVRIGDKIARYKNLTGQKVKQMVVDEKIEDTLLDIVNYSTYGEMLSDNVWND